VNVHEVGLVALPNLYAATGFKKIQNPVEQNQYEIAEEFEHAHECNLARPNLSVV